MQPCMEETADTDNWQVQPTKNLGLDAMPIFMTDTFLTGVTKNDVLTKAYSTPESVNMIEDDTIQKMLFLPLEKEEEKQSKNILWQLPKIRQNSDHRTARNRRTAMTTFVTAMPFSIIRLCLADLTSSSHVDVVLSLIPMSTATIIGRLIARRITAIIEIKVSIT